VPKSLVRIHNCAKKLGTKDYIQATKQFIEKMGGTKEVIETILSLQQPGDTSENDRVLISHGDLEDPNRSM
jgi:hypothetical protein